MILKICCNHIFWIIFYLYFEKNNDLQPILKTLVFAIEDLRLIFFFSLITMVRLACSLSIARIIINLNSKFINVVYSHVSLTFRYHQGYKYRATRAKKKTIKIWPLLQISLLLNKYLISCSFPFDDYNYWYYITVVD